MVNAGGDRDFQGRDAAAGTPLDPAFGQAARKPAQFKRSIILFFVRGYAAPAVRLFGDALRRHVSALAFGQPVAR
jgi:hypothetical protein